MVRAIRQWQPSRFRITPAQQDNLVNILEQTSRGMDTARFSSSLGSIRILVSGFDPFGSDGIRLGNPSGAVAMALDRQYITSGMVTAEIQSVVFPVRFSDFDAGIVEGFFRPYVTGPNPVTLILMLGMQDGDYEVEEYAARVRPTAAPDNAGLTGGGTSTSGTVVPPGVGAGPEFIRGSLPATTRGGLGRTQPVAGETRVRETPAGQSAPVWQTGGPTSGSTAVEGTAGDYFCNEIFYRTALLGQGTTVRIGFMHIPSLGYRLSLPGAATVDVERAGIVTAVRQLLPSALLEYQPGPGDYLQRVLPPGMAYAES